MLYHQDIDVTISPGSTLYLLGQSEDGPVNEPIYVSNMEEAIRTFRGGNLIDAYKQTRGTEDISVFLMRISGEKSRVSLVSEIEGELQPVLSLRSVHGGEMYNSMTASVRKVDVQGRMEEALLIESPLLPEQNRLYILNRFPDMQSLVRQINLDARLKRVHIEASTEHPLMAVSGLIGFNEEPKPFQGGLDGTDLTKNELFFALEKSYGILEGRPIDVICPVPARFDDIHPSVRYGETSYGEAVYGEEDFLGLIDEDTGEPATFHGQLIDFCSTQEQFGVLTHGVIGLQESVTLDDMPAHYIARLAGATAFNDRYGITEYSYGRYIDKGHLMSVYGQDHLFDGKQMNGAPMYAAMIAGLPPDGTTTNHPVPPEAEDLAFELDPEELRILSEIGVVVARGSVRRGTVISNGVTAALPPSPMRSISNVRMIQLTLVTLNQALDGMVGEPYIPGVTLREMEERTRTVLQYLVNRGVLTDFRFNIAISAPSMSADIDLELRPKHSVEFIQAGSSIRFAASGGERN